MNRKYRDLRDRLMANSVVSHENGREHWLWIGARSDDGYPRINVRDNGKHVAKWAHRVSYEQFIGPIPEGHDIDHGTSGCNIRHCINPECLRALPIEVNRGPTWIQHQKRAK